MAVNIVSSFLQDCELFDKCTFEEFQELFPSKYRHNQDVKLLYRAFQRQRRIVREGIQKSIETRYADNVQLLGLERGQSVTSLDTAISELENIKTGLQEDLEETQNKLSDVKEKLDGFSEVLTEMKKIGDLSGNIDFETLEEVSTLVRPTTVLSQEY